MIEAFRCGHFKTTDNVKLSPSNPRGRCRICWQKVIARRNTSKPKGRPRNDYFSADAIAVTEREREDKDRIVTASRKLLMKMLRLGAKSGGCLDISAAQCRARLEALK